MKKTIYQLFMFIMAGMLLTSCSTQLSTVSIKKRHYRNGYYIDIASTKKTTESIAQEKKSGTIAPVTETTPEENTNALITPATTVEATPEKTNDKPTPQTLTASAAKKAPLQLNKVKLKHITSPEELKNITERHESLSAEHKGNNNNGSLIWTIIVILLILWLIAILTGGWGLGGLIYLLLVIALILLILKLLGMI